MATPRSSTRGATKRAPARRRPRKAKAASRGVAPLDSRLETLPAETGEVKARIEREGGYVVGAFSDPLGSHPLLLALLPMQIQWSNTAAAELVVPRSIPTYRGVSATPSV